LRFTDYLAIYAAILSTSVFLWNILQSRPRVAIDLVPGLDDSAAKLRTGVYVIIRNVSSHDVHLAAIDVLYRYTDVQFRDRIAHLRRFRRLPLRLGWVHTSLSNLSIESGCPLRLEARKSHQVFLTDETLEQLLADATDRRLMAHVQDQLWNDVYSRPLTVPMRKRA